MDYKYDVFLSFSSYDNVYAVQMIEKLKNSNIRVCTQKDVQPGDKLKFSIQGSIEKSEYFVFLCSSSFLRRYHKELTQPESKPISHIDYEIKLAVKEASINGLTIIPVVITTWGETTVLSLAKDLFPDCLKIISGGIENAKKSLVEFLNRKREIKNLFNSADQAWIYGAYEQAYRYFMALAEIVDSSSVDSCYNRAAQCCENIGRFDEAEQLYNLTKNSEALKNLEYTKSSNIKSDTDSKDRSADKTLLEKIANYCDASIDLFYELLKNNSTPESINCLETSYSRLLNYCKSTGGMDSLMSTVLSKSNKVIQRLKSEVRANENTEDGKEHDRRIIKSYRNYLGLDFPEADNYDVFISYKTQDEIYARRVYEFLQSEGKKVFFACEVLPEMGKTEYRDAIMDALDHSQHLVLVTSRLDYITSNWVKEEWSFYVSKLIEDNHKGNIAIIEHDNANIEKKQLPPNLRYKQRFKLSNYKKSLLKYLEQ